MMRMVDMDYERFTGRARIATIYDWHSRAWCEVGLIDIGRADRPHASDPDAQTQPERLPSESARRTAWLAQMQERQQRRIAQLAEYIRQNGPVTKAEVGEILGLDQPEHWLRYSGRAAFVRVGYLHKCALFGVREDVTR